MLFSIVVVPVFHSHQQCRRVPFTLSAFIVCHFLMMAGVKRHLTAVLICISLISDAEHLFMCYWPYVFPFGEIST